MHDITPLVFFVSVLVLVLVGAPLLSRWQAKRAKENLATLARDLGLQLHEKPPALGLFPQVPTASGSHRGRTVRLHTFATGSGKQRQAWQALSVSCENPHGLTFQLGTQNFLSALGALLGQQDVQVGDPVFDQRFVVRTNAVDFLRAALLPEIRAALLQHWSARTAGANVKLEGGELTYAELGSFTETAVVDRMRVMLEPLLTLAALPEVYRR
jgi:hypothetical protein